MIYYLPMDTVRVAAVGVGMLVGLSVLFAAAPASAATFNSSNLIEDIEFTNVDSMTVDEVQRFLADRGSFLANFSENGRTAARIIVDAAHGVGDGSGTINGIAITSSTGTVSPAVILVTLQKEQSLLTMTNQNDSALRTAMGYGCPDSGGCNPNYAGFTKQVENGAWQLRYNYERAQGRGFSDYQVGQSACFSNPSGGTDCVTYGNRATASLYRYTPHVYNGNYNFWNMFYNTYSFELPAYRGLVVSQTSYPTIIAGAGTQFIVQVKNTGRLSWSKGVVRLGTDKPYDRISPFLRESGTDAASGWLSPDRIAMQEASVAPGETATFSFWERADSGMPSGTYRENFRIVADGVRWFDTDVWWNVTVVSIPDSYKAQYVTQNAYPTLAPGQSYQFEVQFKNTGLNTWQRNKLNLATDRVRDREPGFDRIGGTPTGWISENRVQLVEESVAPGQTGTFRFWYTVPMGKSAGTYREYFRTVADGIRWLEDYGVYWDVTVQ